MAYSFNPIGIIHSCYKEKFGIPRQPGLVTDAQATLELLAPYNRAEALTGLEACSHLWIIFVFHAAQRDDWKPMVRPPRLGGNTRLGVFATRSPYRPNPLGLSLVKLHSIAHKQGRWLLHLEGADLLDGTPVLDIKPYLPYVEAVPDACGGIAEDAPGTNKEVIFTEAARSACQKQEAAGIHDLQRFIVQLLRQDPRPAYADDGARVYGIRLYDFDLKWKIEDNAIIVTALESVTA